MARSSLFDMYDPYGLIQAEAKAGLLYGDEDPLEEIGGRKATVADLMPQEEQKGYLRRLSELGTSGLSALGWLLDTPGAAVRGALAGKPLSVFGTSEERVTGRDLARQYGLVGNEDTWTNFTGGLVAEVALDPLTYLNPFSILGRGAYGTAGRAAARANLLEDAALMANKQGMGIREFTRNRTARQLIDEVGGDAAERFATAARAKKLNPEDLMDQPLTGLAEFRIPGFEQGTLLSGGAFGDWAAKSLDQFGEALKTNRYTAPIANRVTATFDPSVMEEIDPAKQWVNRQAFSDQRAARRTVRGDFASLQFDALRADASSMPADLQRFTAPRVQNALADLVEANGDISKVIDREAAEAVMAIPEWKRAYEDFAARIPIAQSMAEQSGLPRPTWGNASGTGFFPSQSVWFDNELLPNLPDRLKRTEKPYTRGNRTLNLDDNFARSRDPAYDIPGRRQAFRALMSGDFGRELQGKLTGATDEQIPDILDDAYRTLNDRPDIGGRLGTMYEKSVADLNDLAAQIRAKDEFLARDDILPFARREEERARKKLVEQQDVLTKEIRAKKVKVGDLLRKADTQFADNNMGLFDQSSFDDMLRYETGRATVEANAKVAADQLIKGVKTTPSDQFVGGGWVPLSKAVTDLGFDQKNFRNVLNRAGIETDIAELSVNEKLVESLKRLMPSTAVKDESLLGRFVNTFTNAFKVGALANPAYHTRNLYSGATATLTGDFTNPVDLFLDARAGRAAGRGDYTQLAKRLRTIPRYADPSKTDEDILREFAVDASRNKIGQGEITDLAGTSEQATRGMYPGAAAEPSPPLFGEGGLLWDSNRTLQDWLTVRGVDWMGIASDRKPPSQTKNPLLQLHERVGAQVEDANRMGAFLSQLRQGADPDAAADFVYKTQIDYSPEAFTATERQIKRLVPFYSYQRGIAPLVAENILYRPGGLQTQTVRAINRSSEPNEEFFTPEYLRQSAAIPLPGAAPAEGLQRFLTNIDLPYEGLVNLFSPGVGNSPTQVATSTIQKTGMNLLGQLNPLIKAPLEYILNRQLYTGRELSDLYSVLEQDLGPIGRPLEQAAVNFVPGGSKLNSIYRTLRDERLSPGDKAVKLAVNNLLGVKITDVDQERTRRLAARQMLNELLESTPGVRTYENITVPDDVLARMPENQQKQYLLYRIIQAEAAKRARDRKKQETALDPLQVLGVTDRM
jgi:hypothetical protein